MHALFRSGSYSFHLLPNFNDDICALLLHVDVRETSFAVCSQLRLNLSLCTWDALTTVQVDPKGISFQKDIGKQLNLDQGFFLIEPIGKIILGGGGEVLLACIKVHITQLGFYFSSDQGMFCASCRAHGETRHLGGGGFLHAEAACCASQCPV